MSDPESFGYDSERESSKNRMAYVPRESFRGAWDVKKYADGSKERFLPIFTLKVDRIDFSRQLIVSASLPKDTVLTCTLTALAYGT